MDKPNYILKFNDSMMVPKNETLIKDIAKVLLLIFGIVLLLAIIIFGFGVWKELPGITWIGVFGAFGVLWQQGGYVKRPAPCELWFYDDYLVHHYEKLYYNKKCIRKEYSKFYYKDIKRCLYRTIVNKIVIYGMVEVTYYKYDKNGNIKEKPCHHQKLDGMGYFYTIFEPNIDFVKEIESHCPIKVEYEES